MLSEKEKEWAENTYHRCTTRYQRTPLGLYLRYVRKRNHLTLRRLEEISGVTGAAIVNIEMGRSKNPRVDVLSKLCRALGIDGNTLMEVVNS